MANPLKLEEVKRILDLACSLRDDVDPVEEELEHDELCLRLRDRLIAAAQITGDSLTEDQAAAAVDQYLDHMHEFREPGGVSATIARGYVWLMTLGKTSQ